MLKEHLKHSVPVSIIILALVFAGSISYAFVPKSRLTKQDTKIVPQTEINKTLNKESTKSAQIIESPQPKEVLGISTSRPLPSPSPKVILTPLPAPEVTINPSNTPASNSQPNTSLPLPTSFPTSAPTPTPSPTQSPIPSPNVTASPVATTSINLEINSPDGKSSFSVEITEGMNSCDILQKAKKEGKISSVTLNDKYLESFNTLLVSEINGFKDNWVFTVNGESPMGCSLYFPKTGDLIIWMYLEVGGE